MSKQSSTQVHNDMMLICHTKISTTSQTTALMTITASMITVSSNIDDISRVLLLHSNSGRSSSIKGSSDKCQQVAEASKVAVIVSTSGRSSGEVKSGEVKCSRCWLSSTYKSHTFCPYKHQVHISISLQ